MSAIGLKFGFARPRHVLPGFSLSLSPSPLSTRKRSAGRSATPIRRANFSTVSPRLTSTTLIRSGCADAISCTVMRRNVPSESRKLLSTASVRFFAA